MRGAIQRLEVEPVMDVMFPSFPATPEEQEEAAGLFARLWPDPKTNTLSGPNGVQVSRAGWRRPAPGERRQRLHVTLRYPVPAAEKARIARTLADNVSQENTTWASAYPNIADFAVDESDFSLGLSHGELADISEPVRYARLQRVDRFAS